MLKTIMLNYISVKQKRAMLHCYSPFEHTYFFFLLGIDSFEVNIFDSVSMKLFASHIFGKIISN